MPVESGLACFKIFQERRYWRNYMPKNRKTRPFFFFKMMLSVNWQLYKDVKQSLPHLKNLPLLHARDKKNDMFLYTWRSYY